MKFLPPREGLNRHSELRIVRAPVWPEKEGDPAFRRRSMGGRVDCRFCNLTEEPLHETPHALLLRARFPYLPEHALIVPLVHAKSLDALPPEHYRSVVDMMSTAIRNNRRVIAGANAGTIAGQTLPHLHIHVIRYPLRSEEQSFDIRPVQEGSRAVMMDIVGRAIIRRAVELGDVPYAAERTSQYPSVRMRFKNWGEMAGSQHEIAKVVESLRDAFEDLKRRPPENANPMLLGAISGRTGRKGADGMPLEQGVFGWHWTLRAVGGKPVLEIIPRATGLQHGILEKAQPVRGGMLLERVMAAPSEAWSERQEEFYRKLAGDFAQAGRRPRARPNP